MKNYKETFTVQKEDCISSIDSSLPSLLGTYTLVKWMEIISAKDINQHIDTSKYITVGEQVCIEHTGMVKESEKVEITATIIKEEKREIHFEIEAQCNGKIVAKATHKRIKIPLKVLEKIL